MSISLFRSPPSAFVKHDDRGYHHVHTSRTGSRKPDTSATEVQNPRVLRDDHIVLLGIDALLALHAVAKRVIEQRRTRRILSALDDRQLHDIGLTRSQINDSTLERDDIHRA
jgi:uncharacterized protein YjiS (DUF1127 family)